MRSCFMYCDVTLLPVTELSSNSSDDVDLLWSGNIKQHQDRFGHGEYSIGNQFLQVTLKFEYDSYL